MAGHHLATLMRSRPIQSPLKTSRRARGSRLRVTPLLSCAANVDAPPPHCEPQCPQDVPSSMQHRVRGGRPSRRFRASSIVMSVVGLSSLRCLRPCSPNASCISCQDANLASGSRTSPSLSSCETWHDLGFNVPDTRELTLRHQSPHFRFGLGQDWPVADNQCRQ